jgi:hypothetical protein
LLGLDAGSPALKTFMAGLPKSAEGKGGEAGPDVDALTVIAAEANSALARAEGGDEADSAQLRELEARNAPLMVQAAGAERDAANPIAQFADLEGKPEVDCLDGALLHARQREAAALVSLEDAERAAAHDVAVIERQIGLLDKRVEVARTQRIDLEKAVAGIEARTEAEGARDWQTAPLLRKKKRMLRPPTWRALRGRLER